MGTLSCAAAATETPLRNLTWIARHLGARHEDDNTPGSEPARCLSVGGGHHISRGTNGAGNRVLHVWAPRAARRTDRHGGRLAVRARTGVVRVHDELARLERRSGRSATAAGRLSGKAGSYDD